MSNETAVSVVPPSADPLSLIRDALSAGYSPEILRELLAVKRDWEADQARKDFNLAIAEFQRLAPIVTKADMAHDKQYARMDRIWRETRPLVTQLGLSVTWQVCELRDKICHVEGQLRHKSGHGEKLVMDIPLPDIIRGQNMAQQMGSARTYAQRYAFTSALGVVTGDDADDDGNGAGFAFVSPEQAKQISGVLDAARGLAGWDETAFWNFAGATKVSEIKAGRFDEVLNALKRKLAKK
jgi:hypothetical protein